MATLRDIRRRINAVNNTAKITQAMRMVSAAKLKRAQDAIISARPFAAKLSEMLTNLVAAVGEEYTHPLLTKKKTVENIVVILIGADRGLCGGFNTNLFRMTNKFINEELPKEYPGSKIRIIKVGKRAVLAYKNKNVETLKTYPAAFQPLQFDTAKDIVNTVSELFINGSVDKVYICFNMFKNLLVQTPSVVTLLPVESNTKHENLDNKFNLDYIFEPNKNEILDELLPRHLDIQMWRTLLESNAAEQASRMMAMENATKNAKDLVQYLELVFNKERQAAITKEMLEIVGGAASAGN